MEIRLTITELSDGVARSMETTRQSLELIAGLEGISRKVDKIVDGIAMVSIQTNMLAVNGSVEAARAGEFGKGFAVVSKDIRSLARDSGENAGRIKDTVRTIQDQIASGAPRAGADHLPPPRPKIRRTPPCWRASAWSKRICAEIAASNEQILASAEVILSSTKEAARGAQQVAAAAEEAGSAATQAASAAPAAGARGRGSGGGDRGDRLTGRRHPEPQWLGKTSAPLSSRPAHRRARPDDDHGSPYRPRLTRRACGRVPDRGRLLRVSTRRRRGDHPAARLAHMPLGPRSLLGLANLRGVVLPVVSLRLLLGFPDASADDATRVIVIDRGAPGRDLWSTALRTFWRFRRTGSRRTTPERVPSIPIFSTVSSKAPKVTARSRY